jgi:DNA integrity scanning protein DisA with diadenylate cyclase activity
MLRIFHPIPVPAGPGAGKSDIAAAPSSIEWYLPHLLHSLPDLPRLDLIGAIDVLVVAFVVYQALMVVRGTRAGHILAGIIIMLLLYLGASWSGLEALRSVLSFIVPYTGLAIIVLFQSEIRRTLARLGRKRWFGLGGEYRNPESIGEIMMAVEQLAQQRIGALIVLERDIGLRTFHRKRRASGRAHFARSAALHLPARPAPA